MAAAPKVDYAFFAADWAAGIKTTRQMAAEYEAATGTKVSHESIRKYFTKLGVPRNLKERIKQRAEAMVDKAMVDKSRATVDKVDENDIIAVAARTQADLILTHRKDITRYQKLASSLLEELELQTGNREMFEQLAELLHAPDDRGVDKLNEIYRKVIGTPQRIDGFKKLAETYKVLVGLERQAFGLAENANGDQDKQPENPNLAPNDAARRVAFMLTQALKGN